MTVNNDDGLLRLDNQVCFALYSAANAMVRAYRPMLKALDLTYPQYLTMLVFWAGDQISVKTLGEQLHLDSGTLTPLLKRLESKGLIRRERSDKDERVRVLCLTEAGKALKQQAKEVPVSMLCQAGMPKQELLGMKASCETLLNNLKKLS
ncbi:MAG: DNA-binding MarR family transcriptional regulator [Moritella sp.]|jgi:DNA-binding MarR family transcriptional regulator